MVNVINKNNIHLLFTIITHYFKVDIIDCSLLACRKLLVMVLLFAAVVYLPRLYVSKPSKNNETTKGVTWSIKQISAIARQERTLPLLKNHQTMNATFCQFETNCKTIKCRCIPEQLDPGEVMRNFIENIFKDQCGSNVAINLILEKSTFPDNKLRNMWLKTDVTINELIFNNCFLTELSDTAFSSMIYKRTTKLHLLNNNISILKRATFRHLPNLQTLVIEGNLIRQVERNLLKDVASTLQGLQFEDSIENVQVLQNITGADYLPAVQVLSLRYNNIPIIDSNLFSGVPNIASLYLCGSRVKTIYTGAFKSISRSLKQLMLSENAIASLPKGLFDPIIRKNADFGLTIDNNPWHCNCSLKWMQEMIKYHPNVMKKNLTCTSPEENAGKSFVSANFCDNVTTQRHDTVTVRKTTEITSTPNIFSTTKPAMIHVNCIRHDRLLHSIHSRCIFSTIEMLLPFSDFTAEQVQNGSVLITLPDANNLSLIWFANNLRSNTANLESLIQCVSQVRGSYLLQDLQPRTSYTICLKDNFNFSPLNCLGLTTRSFPESNTWLNGINESVIITIFVASLILMCFTSAILMFVTVRRHPTMLRGSKRVVIVKHRNAIVLPKGLSSDTICSANGNVIPTISRNLKEDGYVTPLPVRYSTRKNSKSSRRSSEQSDGTSYISGIEPTLSQLNSWRLKGESFYVNWEAEPPPLPPYPRHKAQPLSTMKDLNEKESKNATCTI
ncbi:leucine-rich repeat transmembrane protein FLRT1-like [Ooceraea biroi]|uniref:leucine-rich repeat transmembrane protein FLRT1-like n=1 Tax=Ooceraea biroi TaxID=2015173 RepID=UPI0005BCE3A2|nr:leucine-rich repeat transmembrane protein FLRT1-like [Ooceraea biroi]